MIRTTFANCNQSVSQKRMLAKDNCMKARMNCEWEGQNKRNGVIFSVVGWRRENWKFYWLHNWVMNEKVYPLHFWFIRLLYLTTTGYPLFFSVLLLFFILFGALKHFHINIYEIWSPQRNFLHKLDVYSEILLKLGKSP